MWIRSQSKKALLNVSSIHILKDGDMSLMCCVVDGCDYELGVYYTEEKALKVLNEIQEVIEDNQFTINNTGIGDYVLYNSVQVYDMPQDDEV